MVEETFKYVATPDDNATATAAWSHIQTCREVYNHALTQEYRPRPDYDKPSYRERPFGRPTVHWRRRTRPDCPNPAPVDRRYATARHRQA